MDVNVHPSKREIRFRNEPQVRTFVLENVLNHNKSIASSKHHFSPSEPVLEYEKEKEAFVPKMDPQALEIFGYKEDEGLERVVEKEVFPTRKVGKLGNNQPSNLNLKGFLPNRLLNISLWEKEMMLVRIGNSWIEFTEILFFSLLPMG